MSILGGYPLGSVVDIPKAQTISGVSGTNTDGSATVTIVKPETAEFMNTIMPCHVCLICDKAERDYSVIQPLPWICPDCKRVLRELMGGSDNR